jgi:hypothetical protein
MLGYGAYWTAGFSACQWHEITHRKQYGWVDFNFINIRLGYNNRSQDWEFEFYLLGLRFWLMIADPLASLGVTGTHPTDVEIALQEFLKDDAEAR